MTHSNPRWFYYLKKWRKLRSTVTSAQRDDTELRYYLSASFLYEKKKKKGNVTIEETTFQTAFFEKTEQKPVDDVSDKCLPLATYLFSNAKL